MSNLKKDGTRDFYNRYIGQKIKENDKDNIKDEDNIKREKIEENIANRLEMALKKYLKNKSSNKTQRNKFKLNMFKSLSELDAVYDIFKKSRLSGLNNVGSIDKNIHLFDDEEYFSVQLEKCLKRIEEVYEKSGEILSLKQEFNKIYFYKIQDVFLRKMKRKDLIEDIDEEKGKKARKLIREIVKLLYKDDKNFLAEAEKEIQKIKFKTVKVQLNPYKRIETRSIMKNYFVNI